MPYASATAFTAEPVRRPPPPPVLAALVPQDAPLIVTVANQEPRKGLDVLLCALAELRGRGIPFRACLAGGGPRLEDNRRRAHELGLAGQVILPGLVDDPFAFLLQADCFVLPSRSEQSGSLALLEALQAGRPCVVSAVDGILEDLVDGEEGFLVPPGDAGALSRAIERLLAAPALRAQLGQRARRCFEERFAAPPFATALRRLYEEVSAEAEPPRH
jgi:glycosyltransferase involved in cell wall biosynthesis